MNCLKLLPFVLLLIMTACGAQNTEIKSVEKKAQPNESGYMVNKVEKSDEEWKAELDDLEYRVLRHEGTERAFTGDLWDNKDTGEYVCRGCGLSLFDSKTKFKSGTGWPSYYAPIRPEHVIEITDSKFGWDRTEVVCARCDGHLGHIFKDGPKPTGLRYCINSVSLDFVKKEE